ncbi:DUF896 domain-containing protein [Cohnella endophytica]|uniref:UPF0291 protein D7Z26_02780 n=1 Tax=Cohnella endophytica TaxID=2419778 RepID=A0A494Y4G2_9BACL|nr:DUF896 domain-containing protein [Cohnella endophytica]RKP56930.1 DUF896 domain-containing protein [Cohnella endophytica]
MEWEQLINRINELSRKNKAEGLNASEIAERATLRRKYLDTFKQNFRQELDRIEIVDEEPKLRH